MKGTLRNCALAGALAGGAALLSLPASANSLQAEGYYGGSYARLAPEPFYGHKRHSGRVIYGPNVYYGPGFDYGPNVGFPGPDLGIGMWMY